MGKKWGKMYVYQAYVSTINNTHKIIKYCYE